MQKIRTVLSYVVLAAFAAGALTLASCLEEAEAQQGIIPNPAPTLEEQLSSTDGPINMELVWDYIIAEFGNPQTVSRVLIFDVGVPDGDSVFHIQIAAESGESIIHVDVPLEEMTYGGAISNDRLFHFIWFCNNEDLEEDRKGCPLLLASWIIAYDVEARTAFRWPERIRS